MEEKKKLDSSRTIVVEDFWLGSVPHVSIHLASQGDGKPRLYHKKEFLHPEQDKDASSYLYKLIKKYKCSVVYLDSVVTDIDKFVKEKFSPKDVTQP